LVAEKDYDELARSGDRLEEVGGDRGRRSYAVAHALTQVKEKGEVNGESSVISRITGTGEGLHGLRMTVLPYHEIVRLKVTDR
jgi:hypothetical protein